MRPRHWTLAATLVVAVVAGFALRPSADAQDADAKDAEAAAAEMATAIKRGSELFRSKEIGRKSCVTCHEDPDKPQDDLREVKWAYPAYSRRARRIVTLQQKINEMIKYKARGTPLDHDGADIAAIAAYVESIRKK